MKSKNLYKLYCIIQCTVFIPCIINIIYAAIASDGQIDNIWSFNGIVLIVNLVIMVVTYTVTSVLIFKYQGYSGIV